MFRAGLVLLRRVIFAATLLILLICGAEVGVRIYEASTGNPVCQFSDGTCIDPSKLTVPSWSFNLELKPLAVGKVECRDSNSEVEIRTNSLGLRGADPVVPKPQDVCRIVVLGDETIYAPETPDSEHFCTLLQNRLQQQTRMKIEVINAGIPGHCPLSEFLLYKQRLMNMQPDLVLLHFDWSDVADDRQIRRLARCDETGIPQACPNSKLIAAKKFRACVAWRQQFRLLDLGLSGLSSELKQQLDRQKASSRDLDTNPYAWLRQEHPEKNLDFSQTVKPILDLSQLCRASNCPIVLLTSPKPWQVSAKCSRGEGVRLAAGVSREAFYSSRAPFKVLERFAERHQIPFLDGSLIMPPTKETEECFLRFSPRWSPIGHHQMSESVASFLIEKIPGAWNSPYFQRNEQPVSLGGQRGSSIQWTSGEKHGPDR